MMGGGYYAISKDFEFSAEHHLAGLPEGHKCARPHGHNFVVRVELESTELNDAGFVIDYGDLAPLGRWLDETFDHRSLNDAVGFNPTAELMAAHVYHWCQDQEWPVVKVGWSETPRVWAWYEEPRWSGPSR